jgi:hypothetical protein
LVTRKSEIHRKNNTNFQVNIENFPRGFKSYIYISYKEFLIYPYEIIGNLKQVPREVSSTFATFSLTNNSHNNLHIVDNLITATQLGLPLKIYNSGCHDGILENPPIIGFLSLGFPKNLATFVHGLSLVEVQRNIIGPQINGLC